MKCIKVIKQTKSYELGEIRRMDDLEAESKVKTGYWASIEEKKLKRKKNDKK